MIESSESVEAMHLEPYKVRLDVFEGPLDLLLHLIKKHEMDISKVSIALITDQYLHYIDIMKTLNLEVAGEYLLMAATMAHIKSKSLLPEDSVPDQELENEEESEESLIKRLLEYQKFKEAGQFFENRPWVGRDVFLRLEKMTTTPSNELHAVSLFSLVELFYERLKKIPKIFEHEITLERVTVAERIQEVMSQVALGKGQAIDFMVLLGETRSRYEVIVTFLALLEMVRVNLVYLSQADTFSPILISKGRVNDAAFAMGEINYAE